MTKQDAAPLNRKAAHEGKIIFHEGDSAMFAYLLTRGKVEISTERNGRRVVLTTIQPNQLFGELALLDNSPRSATATAVEPSEFVLVTQEDIDRQLENTEGFMKYWVEYLTERIRDLSARVHD